MNQSLAPDRYAPVQAVASAILAPSLRHVADSLSLSWRRQLTAAAQQRYLARINFYTTSQLAGMQVWRQCSASCGVISGALCPVWALHRERRVGK